MPTSTWLFRILPYHEQTAIYDVGLDHYKSLPMGVENPPHTGFATPIPLYACPGDWRPQDVQTSREGRQVALTNYVGVMGPNWFQQEGTLISERPSSSLP